MQPLIKTESAQKYSPILKSIEIVPAFIEIEKDFLEEEKEFLPDFNNIDVKKRKCRKLGLVDLNQKWLDTKVELPRLQDCSHTWQRISDCFKEMRTVIIPSKEVSIQDIGNGAWVEKTLKGFEYRFSFQELYATLLNESHLRSSIDSFNLVGGAVWSLLQEYSIKALEIMYKTEEFINPLFKQFLEAPPRDIDTQIHTRNIKEWQSIEILDFCMSYLGEKIQPSFNLIDYFSYIKSLKKKYSDLELIDTHLIRQYCVEEFSLKNFLQKGNKGFNRFSLFSVRDKNGCDVDVLIFDECKKPMLRHPLKIAFRKRENEFLISLESCDKNKVTVPQSFHFQNMMVLYIPDFEKVDPSDIMLQIFYGGTYELIRAESEEIVFKNAWKMVSDFTQDMEKYWLDRHKESDSFVAYLMRACRYLYKFPKYSNVSIKKIYQKFDLKNEIKPIHELIAKMLMDEDISFSTIYNWLQGVIFLFPRTLTKWCQKPVYRYEQMLFDFSPVNTLVAIQKDIFPQIHQKSKLTEFLYESLGLILSDHENKIEFPSPWLKLNHHLNIEVDQFEQIAIEWIHNEQPLYCYLGMMLLLTLPRQKVDEKQILLVTRYLPKVWSLPEKWRNLFENRLLELLEMVIFGSGLSLSFEKLKKCRNEGAADKLSILIENLSESYPETAYDLMGRKQKVSSSSGVMIAEGLLKNDDMSRSINMLERVDWEIDDLLKVLCKFCGHRQGFLHESTMVKWAVKSMGESQDLKSSTVQSLGAFIFALKGDHPLVYQLFRKKAQKDFILKNEGAICLKKSFLQSRYWVDRIESILEQDKEMLVDCLEFNKFQDILESFSSLKLAHEAARHILNAASLLLINNENLRDPISKILLLLKKQNWKYDSECSWKVVTACLSWMDQKEIPLKEIVEYIGAITVEPSYKEAVKLLLIETDAHLSVSKFIKIWAQQGEINQTVLEAFEEYLYFFVLQPEPKTEKKILDHMSICHFLVTNLIQNELIKNNECIHEYQLFLALDESMIQKDGAFKAFQKLFNKLSQAKTSLGANAALELLLKSRWFKEGGQKGILQQNCEVLIEICAKYPFDLFDNFTLLGKLYHVMRTLNLRVQSKAYAKIHQKFFYQILNVMKPMPEMSYGTRIRGYEKSYLEVASIMAGECFAYVPQFTFSNYVNMVNAMLPIMRDIVVKHDDFNVTNLLFQMLWHQDVKTDESIEKMRYDTVNRYLAMLPDDYKQEYTTLVKKKIRKYDNKESRCLIL